MKMEIIAKKYTKKQIAEAIEFWKKILENKSPLLDSLVNDYGYGAVFNGVPVPMTIDGCKKIFNRVNSIVFGKKMKMWPFVIDDALCRSNNAICGYVHSLISNAKLGKYDVVTKKTIDGDDVLLPPKYALSNVFKVGSFQSLPMIVSLIAHEMIHQFNYEHENEGVVRWMAEATNSYYNMHGENFEIWMKIFDEEYGIHIEKSGQNSLKAFDKSVIDALKKFAGNSYLNEIEKTIKHNTKGYEIIKQTKNSIVEVIF